VIIIFSLQIVRHRADDMDVALASITLVKQLHFRMLTFGNSAIPFLASSTYQTAHIVPVVGISAGSSKTSGRISTHHHGIPILVDMSKSCSLLCSILVPIWRIRAFSIGLPTVKCGGRTAKSSEFGSRPARQRPK
jgi:hypothetical protein